MRCFLSRVKVCRSHCSMMWTYAIAGFDRQNQHSPANRTGKRAQKKAARSRRTNDLLCRISARSFGPALLCNEAVFQIMFRASTSPAHVTFSRLFATCVTHRMFRWTISDKMTWLCAGISPKVSTDALWYLQYYKFCKYIPRAASPARGNR